MNKQRLRTWLGLSEQSNYVMRFLHTSNIRAAVYMSAIVVTMETWMILSLARAAIEGAAAGKERDLLWFFNHGAWYIVLLSIALVTLVHTVRYARGKTYNVRTGKILITTLAVACLAFGIHYGNNSYLQGEQALAFVTMSLFVFGLLTWRPISTFIGTAVVFSTFYALINSGIPATYGLQVNLFTLWISTVAVALSTYRQKTKEAEQAERLERNGERLRYIASYDELTGIPNMHTFNNAVSVLFEGIEGFDVEFSVLYMDIENFKAYNDKHGFAAGDNLLREVAEGLSQVFKNELVARYSDDHFVALCESNVAEARVEAAHRLVRELRGDVRLHLKAGIFEPTMREDIDVSHACDMARIACNGIKKHPGVHLARYDKSLDTAMQRRQHVINNVKRAVNEGWIKVYYQPVVRCADGSAELYGYEALARWDDPEFGLLPPFAFIETLEEFREIDKLDRCIIEQVCRDLRAEMDAGKDVVPVSLNFSRLDFELYDVPAFMHEMSTAYGVPSSLLDVEITESALTSQLRELQQNMDTLRDERFSLWLDDFGSGYSSLNVLKDFQFNVLKIDMAFLRGFEDNAKSRPILKAIVDLAHGLGMVTLCEGVETQEQFEFLSSIGCDRAQGYHFGKPDPVKLPPATI
ncbi:MAG: EAL domain-containing protein [Atopobiaceae bacterium]|nr:EAL domain-containing protein [Atopobiaceae bacterium]